MENGFRFPLFVDLRGKRAVVVGGGDVACRRSAVLQEFGADVLMIAPEIKAALEGVAVLRRPYLPGDLTGAFLAVAATDNRAVNRAVGEEAGTLGIFVSVADAPEACTFFFPSVCIGRDVVAGIVSRGRDHSRTAAAARAIRLTLEELP